MDLDDLDIYNDLDTFQQEEEKKSAELLSLESKYNDSLKTIEALQAENADLKKQIKRIGINFQNLLDTAKAEVKRKDKQIEQLRKEKDDICFRRKQPRQEYADIASASHNVNKWNKKEALVFPPQHYEAEYDRKEENRAVQEPVRPENNPPVTTSNYHTAESRGQIRMREEYKYAQRDGRLDRKHESDLSRDQVRRHQTKGDQHESTRHRARSRERQNNDRNSTREYSRARDGRATERLRWEERDGKQKRSNSNEKDRDSYSSKSDNSGRRQHSNDKSSDRARHDREYKSRLHTTGDSRERYSGRTKAVEDTNKKIHEIEDRAREKVKNSQKSANTNLVKDSDNNKTRQGKDEKAVKDVGAKNENAKDVELVPTKVIENDRSPKKSKDIETSNDKATLCENMRASKTEESITQNSLTKEKLLALEKETHKTPTDGMTTPKKAALFDRLFGRTPNNAESASSALLSNVIGLIKGSNSISTSPSNYTDTSEQIAPASNTNSHKSNIDECFIPIKGGERKPAQDSHNIVTVIDIGELNDVHIPGLGTTPVKIDLTVEQCGKKPAYKENKTHATEVITTSVINAADTLQKKENFVLIELLSDEEDFIEIEKIVQKNDTTNINKVVSKKVDFQGLTTVQPYVNGEIQILENVRLPNIYEIRAQQRRLREEAAKNASSMKTTFVKDATLWPTPKYTTAGVEQKEAITNKAAKDFNNAVVNIRGADLQHRNASLAKNTNFSDSQMVENVVMDASVVAICYKVEEDMRDSKVNNVNSIEKKNVEEKPLDKTISSRDAVLSGVKPLDANKVEGSLVHLEPEFEKVTEKLSNDISIMSGTRELEQKDSICDTATDSPKIANKPDIQSMNKIDVYEAEEKSDCQIASKKSAPSNKTTVETKDTDKSVGAICEKVKEDMRDSKMNNVNDIAEKNAEEKPVDKTISSTDAVLSGVKPLDIIKVKAALVHLKPESEMVTEKPSSVISIKSDTRELKQKDSIFDTPASNLQTANKLDSQSTCKIEANNVEEKSDCQKAPTKCAPPNKTAFETKDSEQLKPGRQSKGEIQVIKAKDTILAFDESHQNSTSVQKKSVVSENNRKSRTQSDLSKEVGIVREKEAGKVQVTLSTLPTGRTKQTENVKDVGKTIENAKSSKVCKNNNYERASLSQYESSENLSANIQEVTSGIEANSIAPDEVAIELKNASVSLLAMGSLQKPLNLETSIEQKDSAEHKIVNAQKMVNEQTIVEMQKVVQEQKVLNGEKIVYGEKAVHEQNVLHEQKDVLEQKALEDQTVLHDQELVYEQKNSHEQNQQDFQEILLEQKVLPKQNITDEQNYFDSEKLGDPKNGVMQKAAEEPRSIVIENENNTNSSETTSANSRTIPAEAGISSVAQLVIEEKISKTTIINHFDEILIDNNANLGTVAEFDANVKTFVENKPSAGADKAAVVDDANSQIEVEPTKKENITAESEDKELEDAVTYLLKSMNEEETSNIEETKVEFSLQYEKPTIKAEHKPVEADLKKNKISEAVNTTSGKNSKTKIKELSKSAELPSEHCALIDSMKRAEIMWKFKIPKISAKRKRENCEEVNSVKLGTAVNGEVSKNSATNSAQIEERTKRSKKNSKKEESHAIKQKIIFTEEEPKFVEINAIVERELIDTRLLNGRTPEEAQALSAEKAKSERIIKEIDNWARRKVGDTSEIIESVMLLDASAALETSTKVDKVEMLHSTEKLELIDIEYERSLVTSSKEVQKKPEEMNANIMNATSQLQLYEQREEDNKKLLTNKAAVLPEDLGSESSHLPNKRFKYNETADKRVSNTLTKRKTDECKPAKEDKIESKLQKVSAVKSSVNIKEKSQCLTEIQESRKSPADQGSRCTQKRNAKEVQTHDGKYTSQAIADEQTSCSEEKPTKGSQMVDERDPNAAAMKVKQLCQSELTERPNTSQNENGSTNDGTGTIMAADEENGFVDVLIQNQLKVEISSERKRKTNEKSSTAQIQKLKKSESGVENDSKISEIAPLECSSKVPLTKKDADATTLTKAMSHDKLTQNTKCTSKENFTEDHKSRKENVRNAVVGKKRATEERKSTLSKAAVGIDSQEKRAKLELCGHKKENAHKTPGSTKKNEVPLAVADSSKSLSVSNDSVASHSKIVESNTSQRAEKALAKIPKRRRSDSSTSDASEVMPKSRSRKRCKMRIEDSEEEEEEEEDARSTEFSTTAEPTQNACEVGVSDLPQNSDILDILQNDKANESNDVLPAPQTPTSLPANISQDEQYRELDSRLEQMFASPKVTDKTAATAAQVRPIPKLFAEIAATTQSSQPLSAEAAEECTHENPASQLPTPVVEVPSTSNATPAVDFNVSDTFLSDISSNSLQVSNMDVTIDETDQSASQMMNSSLSDSNASTKHISLGSSNYRFEKVSDNVVNLFITRKRRGKRKQRQPQQQQQQQ